MMRFGRLCPPVVALYLVFARSVGGAVAAPEKSKVTIAIAGTSAQIYFLAVNVAKAHGYFKDEGLDIETVDFAGGAKALEAVVGGSADIDAGSFEHTLQMQAKGQGVQCIERRRRAQLRLAREQRVKVRALRIRGLVRDDLHGQIKKALVIH